MAPVGDACEAHAMRKIGLLALTAALAMCVGGCSSSGGEHQSQKREVSGGGLDSIGPNPVAILKKIPGCVIPAGTTVGEQSLGVRSASCQVNDPDPSATDGDQITVYTSSDSKSLQAELTTQGGASTDGTKVIAGNRFFLTDTGSIDINNGGGTKFYLDPNVVAQSVGGTVR